MEYDDYYHPSYENNNHLQNIMNELKLMDKGYNRFKTIIKTPNNKKKIPIELYSSGDTGSNIRDAITGQYYSFKVGSIQEDSFFKVSIVTGEINNNRRLFFFNSPLDYERLFHVELKEKNKFNWAKRQRLLQNA
jgi:hypothetical protein